MGRLRRLHESNAVRICFYSGEHGKRANVPRDGAARTVRRRLRQRQSTETSAATTIAALTTPAMRPAWFPELDVAPNDGAEAADSETPTLEGWGEEDASVEVVVAEETVDDIMIGKELECVVWDDVDVIVLNGEVEPSDEVEPNSEVELGCTLVLLVC